MDIGYPPLRVGHLVATESKTHLSAELKQVFMQDELLELALVPGKELGFG